MSTTNKISIFFLALSGLLITVVSMFFSIKGFLLFIPDVELYWGLLGLGIAFELGKITASTFLFHKSKDSSFPIMFKLIMTISVIALIFFSALFTFVHLNASASKSLASNNTGDTQVITLEERNKTIDEKIQNIENQINSVDPKYTKSKIRLYNSLNPEKEKLQLELDSNIKTIANLKNKNVESDQFIFLETLTKFTGIDKAKIFFYVTLFIVIIIDPLAISLFLCATYIYNTPKDEIIELTKVQKDNIEIQNLLITAIESTPEPELTTKEILDNFLKGHEETEIKHSIVK